MKIGFTGTREGMTSHQAQALREMLWELPVREFHHGDCVGSDDQAATTVHEFKALTGALVEIVCHPPIDKGFWADNPHSGTYWPAKTHFARNRDIVDNTDMLVATPKFKREITKDTMGGTAMTVNYARKQGKPVRVIWPDGTVAVEGGVEKSTSGCTVQ